MNNFRKELDRYGKQLRDEKCPLSDAMLDKAIRHATWQERGSKDAPHAIKATPMAVGGSCCLYRSVACTHNNKHYKKAICPIKS